MDLRTALPSGFDSWVICVPAGTVVGQDDDGNDMIVTDTTAVNKGNKWWVTEKVYQQIKSKSVKRMS